MTEPTGRLYRAYMGFTKKLTYGATAYLMGIMFLAVIDVLMTKFFSRPVLGASEVIAEGNVLLVTLCIAYVQLERGHIAVDLLGRYLGRIGRLAFRILDYVLSIGICLILSWRGYVLTAHMIALHMTKPGVLKFPLFPFALIMATCFALLVVSYAFTAMRDVRRWASIRHKEGCIN